MSLLFSFISHKNLELLTRGVDKMIPERHAERFALVFEGRSSGDTHFVACYESFASKNKSGDEVMLLIFSRSEDELSQNESHHLDYFKHLVNLIRTL